MRELYNDKCLFLNVKNFSVGNLLKNTQKYICYIIIIICNNLI